MAARADANTSLRHNEAHLKAHQTLASSLLMLNVKYLNFFNYGCVALIELFFFVQRYDDAIEAFERGLKFHPEDQKLKCGVKKKKEKKSHYC